MYNDVTTIIQFPLFMAMILFYRKQSHELSEKLYACSTNLKAIIKAWSSCNPEASDGHSEIASVAGDKSSFHSQLWVT